MNKPSVSVRMASKSASTRLATRADKVSLSPKTGPISSTATTSFSLIIGMTQGYVAYYQFPFESFTGINLGNGFSLLAPYLIMFVILIVKPDGLFGTEEVERV